MGSYKCLVQRIIVIDKLSNILFLTCSLQGHQKNNEFIITQWPLSDTEVDLWRLCVDYKGSTIVAFNNLEEKVPVCHIYVSIYGNFHSVMVAICHIDLSGSVVVLSSKACYMTE